MVQPLTLPSADLVVEARARVGEGPVIDGRTGNLCWVDIPEGILHESDLSTGATTSVTYPTQLGAIAPRRDGTAFAAAVFEGFGFCDGETLTIADPVLPEPRRRMNDAKCDSRGRLWAGSTHTEYTPGFGRLHRWDGRESTVAAEGLVLPNGIGWSPDDSTMYLVDSFAQVLMRADFDPDDGAVGPFSVVREIGPGFPDGLAVDQDGCLWIAVWGDGEVRRYSPTGEVLAIVPVPVSQPASCAFGPDGTLYITTAREGLNPEQLVQQPLAGSVFAAATSARGVPVMPFAG